MDRWLVVAVGWFFLTGISCFGEEPQKTVEVNTVQGTKVQIHESELVAKFTQIIREKKDTYSKEYVNSDGSVTYEWPVYRFGGERHYLAFGSDNGHADPVRNEKDALHNTKAFCHMLGFTKSNGYQEALLTQAEDAMCIILKEDETIARVSKCTFQEIKSGTYKSYYVTAQSLVIYRVACKR